MPDDPVVQDEAGPAEIPQVYANGFQIGLSNADITLVLKLDNQPIYALHMSYTLAKTLHLKMGHVVERLEEAVDKPMLTTDEITTALATLAASGDENE